MEQSYRKLFKCPNNFKLDTVICTTMTIDASAAVNLIAIAAYPDCDPLEMTQDQITVLVNGQFSKKFHFFYDEKKPIKCENTNYPEKSLSPVFRQMYPVKCNTIFHPKIILARFENKNDPDKWLWRLMVSSHNLTLSKVYEVGIILESQLDSSSNHNMDKFLSFLTDNSQIDVNIMKEFKKYGDELSAVKFIEDDPKYDIEVAVSGLNPDMQSKLFTDLEIGLKQHKDQWLIVSPSYETGEDFQDTENYRIFAPCRSTEEQNSNKSLFQNSHAKMYIHYKNVNDEIIVDQLLLGSMNCSESGLKSNIECLVKISLKDNENNSINGDNFHIKNINLTEGKESFIFDGTMFERIDDFTDISYDGIDLLRRIMDEYEFDIQWSMVENYKKNNANVYIRKKNPANADLSEAELSKIWILPYSMRELKSSTAKNKSKWERIKINENIFFHGDTTTDSTQILRIRYDDSFSIHESIWFDSKKLVNPSETLNNHMKDFLRKPYASLFQEKNGELYWKEFWELYKTFCEEYKNDISILNELDKQYRFVWAARCVQSEWDNIAEDSAVPKQLPAALERYSGLMPYQKSAIDQAVNSFNEGKRFYLVADEAGLGKTYVAQGIIKRLFEQWKKENIEKCYPESKTFNVAYFCSNLLLLDRTADKLMRQPNGEKDKSINRIENVDRISKMLGAFKEEYLNKLKKGEPDPFSNITKVEKDKINLFMMSINLIGDAAEIKSKDGNFDERRFLEKFKEILGVNKPIEIKYFRDLVCQYLKSEKKLDLIIFDEFHRYSDEWKNVFESLSFEGTKVLLLSATPYNWYSSAALESEYFIEKVDKSFIEDEDSSDQSNLKTFSEILDLIECDDNTKYVYEKFKKEYRAYISGCKSNNIEEYARQVSQELKKYVWRNERIYSAENKRHELPGREILAGPEWQRAVKGQLAAANEENGARYKALFPGVYSFAIRTLVKGGETKGNNKKVKKDTYKDLVKDKNSLKEEDFLFDSNNLLKADMLRDNLRTESIRRLQVEPMRGMLWLTPSISMYEPSLPFTKDSTKLLVFSAYKMVPRGAAAIFSSYVAGDVVGENSNTESRQQIVDKSIAQIKNLDEKIFEYGLLDEVASIFVPNYIGEKLSLSWVEFRDKFIKENEVKLQSIIASNEIETSKEILGMYILASPLICLYRILKDQAKAVNIANSFYGYFKQQGIKQVLSKALEDMPYKNELEKLLNYCGAGCLQDVLFEYSALTKSDFEKCIQDVLEYEGSIVHVLNIENYETAVSDEVIKDETEKWAIKCRFADRFTPDFSDTGVSETSIKGMTHQKVLQQAFNSPFWPMILCTTSAGQEGVDLDAYCRRIMHYSIPNSPMSFEQRDGRIDRRMSLASRQRMTQLWGNAVCMLGCKSEDYWKQLYSQCIDNSGMSPLWSMREDTDKIRIERLIPFVPQSKEDMAYRQLVDLKMKYRRSFGKPDEPGDILNEIHIKLNDI